MTENAGAEKKIQPVKQENKLPQIKMDGFSVMPATYEEFYRFSNMIASSDLVPKDYKGNPGNVMVAIQMGAEVGLKPLQAIQGIAVINGRPSLWGDAVLALIQSSGLLQDLQEWFDEASGTAHCLMHRAGYSKPTVRTFSMADAKAAGLAGKQGPWTNYPKRMLQMRARGFCARDAFADILRGVHVAEEAQDIEPLQGPKVYTAAEVMPIRASESAQSQPIPAQDVDKPAEEEPKHVTVTPIYDAEAVISNSDIKRLLDAISMNPACTKENVSLIISKFGYKKVNEIQYKNLDVVLDEILSYNN